MPLPFLVPLAMAAGGAGIGALTSENKGKGALIGGLMGLTGGSALGGAGGLGAAAASAKGAGLSAGGTAGTAGGLGSALKTAAPLMQSMGGLKQPQEQELYMDFPPLSSTPMTGGLRGLQTPPVPNMNRYY